MTQEDRRSPGRPPVPVDRIVAMALQIVDDDGAEALSMRTLAQRLDSGTATLYRHFASRADVVARVVDLVFGTVEVTAAELRAMTWQNACKTGAYSMFDALRRHPNVAPLLAEGVPIGPHALAAREALIAILLENGFPAPLAAQSYATLARYVLGFAIQLTGAPGNPDDARLAQVTQVFQALDPDIFPATVAVADHLPVPLDDEFAFGLELIVDGLPHALARSSGRQKPKRRSG